MAERKAIVENNDPDNFYKKCRSFIFLKKNGDFNVIKKSQDEDTKFVASYFDKHCDIFSYYIIDENNKRYISSSVKMDQLNQKLKERFKRKTNINLIIEGNKIQDYTKYKDIIEDMKKAICNEEGIEK